MEIDKKFNNLDKTKAYWLGFLAADGYVYKNYLCLGISEKDLEHLKKFKNFMEVKNKIEENDITNSVRIRIGNKKLVKNLKRYNIRPRKSYMNESLIEYIPDSMKGFFIAGFFDGDGSVFSYKAHKGEHYAVNITSNKQTLEDIIKFFSKFYNFRKLTLIRNSSVWRLRWDSKHDIKEFFKLYKKSPIHLRRKMEKFNDIIPKIERKVGRNYLQS